MYERNRAQALVVLMLFSITVAACMRSPAPEASFWSLSTGKYASSIDHGQWQDILDRYVVAHDDAVNRVDYAQLAARGMPDLDRYLTSMIKIDPRDFPRDEQIAYWINVYNAVTLQRVALEWPTTSILSLGGGLTNSGPWDETLIEIAGKPLSLNDIEHTILRVVWKEPRIHFAVNCASIGCPDLRHDAFRGDRLEAQLAAAAQAYLASERGVRASAETLTLSSIFDWYASDFGETETDVLAYLASLAAAPSAALLRGDYTTIRYDYDWTINAVE